jgi:hypothetical protein
MPESKVMAKTTNPDKSICYDYKNGCENKPSI